MENSKDKFKKLYSKYNSKRDFFVKCIDRFKIKGSTDLYAKAEKLLQEVDDYAKELKEGFTLTVEGQPSVDQLNEKLKNFKCAYKKLSDMTKPVWRQWIEAIVVAGTLVFVLRTFIFGLYHVPTGSAEPNILVGDRIWGNKMAYYLGKVKRGDLIIFDNPEFIYDKSNPINYFWQKYVGLPFLFFGAGPDNWVKRVIGLPGDVIEGRIEYGKTTIYLNGEKLDETSYVNPFPLIKLRKSVGLINFEDFGPLRIPAFLRKMSKIVDYTYDPDKDFKDQPFYNMSQDEVIRRSDGSLVLREPYSPSYEFGNVYGDFSRSVDSFGPIRVPEGKYWVMGDSRKNSRDSRYWGFLDEDLIHGKASFVIYSVDSEESFWLFELIKHPIKFWTNSLRWGRFFKSLNKK